MDKRGKGKLSDQMKGKYCIFYEGGGGRVVRQTGSGKTRATEQSRWTVREAKRRWRIRSLLKRRSKLECVGGLQKERGLSKCFITR